MIGEGVSGSSGGRWTEALAECVFSGVGSAANARYEDRRRTHKTNKLHAYEDLAFRVTYNDVSLYGVFDGHDNAEQFVEFAEQKLLAEIFFSDSGQLNEQSSNEQVREVLRTAIVAVETSFFDRIAGDLATRAHLRQQICQLTEYEAHRRHPDVIDELRVINEQKVNGGASLVLALLVGDRLFVANVGDCRALICQSNDAGALSVTQISVQHDTKNSDEQLRLRKLGLADEAIEHWSLPYSTRSLGDTTRKRSYLEIEQLAHATDDPVIAEPDLTGPFMVSEEWRVLVLMSAGVYSAWEDATGSTAANADITSLTMTEAQTQSSPASWAQAVVDKIARTHRETFADYQFRSQLCESHEDMTIVLRRFNQELGELATNNQESNTWMSDLPSQVQPTFQAESGSESDEDTNTITGSGEETGRASRGRRARQTGAYQLDSDGRIASYVDFSQYYALLAQHNKQS